MRHAFLRKGATIEVFAEGDWWLAQVVAINKNFVRVHYEGGEDDEDEWLEQSSDRVKEHTGTVEPDGDPAAAGADGGPSAAGSRADAAGAKTPSAKGRGGGSGKKAKSAEKVLGAEKGAEKGDKLDDKARELLGPGWERIARNKGGHYNYIAPDGSTFSSLSVAAEYASRGTGAGAGAGDSGKRKKGKQADDRGEGGGASAKKSKAAEEPAVAVGDEQVVPERLKTARPFDKAYLREVEAIWHHAKFGKLRAEAEKRGLLRTDGPEDQNSVGFIANLVAIVQQAFDVHLGRDARAAKKREMDKVPGRIFRDYRREGALLIVLEHALEYMRDEDIETLEQLKGLVLDQEHEDEVAHLGFLSKIRQALMDTEHHVPPTIFFSSALQSSSKNSSAQMEQYRVWAQGLSARVTDEEQQATHIIVPDTDDMAETSQTYCRQIDRHHPGPRTCRKCSLSYNVTLEHVEREKGTTVP